MRAASTRSATETVSAARDSLHEAKAEENIQEDLFDSASEFLSADMATALRNLGPAEHRGEGGSVVVHSKPPGRKKPPGHQ